MNTTTSFAEFYRHHFLPEHHHPANVALHVAGTLLALLWVPVALVWWSAWWLLLLPLIHAAPGLIGHRLFERSAAVGDLRMLRRDFSPLWFIAANHVLTARLARAFSQLLVRRARAAWRA